MIDDADGGSDGLDSVVEGISSGAAANGSSIGAAIPITEGADQDGTLDVTLAGGATLSTSLSFLLDGTPASQSATVTASNGEVLGILTISTDANGDANWLFYPASVDNSNGDPSFTFVATVTDTDGDVASDSHTVTITEGARPARTYGARSRRAATAIASWSSASIP